MAGLSIGVVGGLRVAAGDGRALRITSRKAQALLGCLALEPGTRLSRDLLASLLWEDSDPELARASLRQALAALRKALPDEHLDALRSDAGAVWLDGSKVETDLAGFRAGLRAGSFDASAADVPVEELLAGLEAKSIAFEQWLDQQRGVFRRQRIEALEHVAARCGATWRPRRTAGRARTAAHARTGQRASTPRLDGRAGEAGTLDRRPAPVPHRAGTCCDASSTWRPSPRPRRSTARSCDDDARPIRRPRRTSRK